jgi:hypothetical protein
MILAMEGKKLLESGQYEAAVSKFYEVGEKAATSDIKHLKKIHANAVRNKWVEIFNLFALGKNAAKNGDFA